MNDLHKRQKTCSGSDERIKSVLGKRRAFTIKPKHFVNPKFQIQAQKKDK